MKKFFILLSIMLSLSIGYPNSLSSNAKDGTTILLIATSASSSSPRLDSILASINGEILTITFIEPLGRVTIIIEDSSGAPVEFEHGETPNGFMY